MDVFRTDFLLLFATISFPLKNHLFQVNQGFSMYTGVRFDAFSCVFICRDHKWGSYGFILNLRRDSV